MNPMHSVTGIFSTVADADRARKALRALPLGEDAVKVFTPGTDPRSAPVTTGEQPGLGRAIGGVTGGAAGASVGVQVLAAATGTVPGIGPALAVGAIAGMLAGIAGAAAGQAIENALTEGLPKDELYFYEEALRQGQTVVIVQATDAELAQQARATLQEAGAESLDAARERWWIGLRDIEARECSPDHPSIFAEEDADFRRGFEMAVHLRGQPWEDAAACCRQTHPEACDRPAYRRGFERGRAYAGRHVRSD